MFSLPILIVVAAALAATGITALGLSLFFRVLDSASSASEPAVSTERSRSRD